jgi:hypothetical protein
VEQFIVIAGALAPAITDSARNLEFTGLLKSRLLACLPTYRDLGVATRFAEDAGAELKLYGLLTERHARDDGGAAGLTCGAVAGWYALGRDVDLFW